MKSSFVALAALLAVCSLSPAQAKDLRHTGAGYVLTGEIPDDWAVEKSGPLTQQVIAPDDVAFFSVTLVRDDKRTVDDARLDAIARSYMLGAEMPAPKRLSYSKVAGFNGAAYGSQTGDAAINLTIMILDPNTVAIIGYSSVPETPRSAKRKYEKFMASMEIAKGY